MTAVAVVKPSFDREYGHLGGFKVSAPRIYSRFTLQALILLGSQVKLARKSRRMSETELAERAGIARSTLQKIEKGDPRVDIGLVFEAATLSGVGLFDPDATTLAPQINRLEDKLALLPKAIRAPRRPVNDDF